MLCQQPEFASRHGGAMNRKTLVIVGGLVLTCCVLEYEASVHAYHEKSVRPVLRNTFPHFNAIVDGLRAIPDQIRDTDHCRAIVDGDLWRIFRINIPAVP